MCFPEKSPFSLLPAAGTMMQLLSEAAAQENKEAVLAYTVLVLENRPMSAAAVRTRCNEMLQTMAPDSTSVDFDVADALSEITSAGLCTLCDNKDVQVCSVPLLSISL
jgi:hypothetical protein